MVGAVVEVLSTGKLCAIFAALALAQLVFFLLGGLISPEPSSHMSFLTTKCIDGGYEPGGPPAWIHLRPNNCHQLHDTLDYHRRDPREIVYVAQMPHMRDGVVLEYSPWFQSILAILVVHTEYANAGQVWDMAKEPTMTLEVRLGYRKHGEPSSAWHELASSTISRQLTCTLHPDEKQDGGDWSCDPVDLFEVGSSAYPFYLLNIRLPGCNESRSMANCHIGRITDLDVVAIHQNGGFTQVWLSLKTLLFPLVSYFLYWYWARLRQLPRPPVLLEKSILGLGLVMAVVDCPVEWLSLWLWMPWLLLVSDIRQGLFYLALGGFWMIYAGEHLTGDVTKHELSWYWKRLGSLVAGCACLLIYDCCERGVRLRDPFYSLWATHLGTNLAYGFIVLAGICAMLYFFYMSVLLVRVWLNIKRKREGLRAASEGRRVRFAGIIYRLKFLTALTAVCLALTVAAAMMERGWDTIMTLVEIGEGQLHWGDFEDAPALNYSSAFLTGVFGMWNLYVLLLLWMYAPSHKRYHYPIGKSSAFLTGVFGMWNLYVLLLLWMYAPSHKRYHYPIDEDDKSDDVLVVDGGEAMEASVLTTFVKPADD